jgi:hypothetical protein
LVGVAVNVTDPPVHIEVVFETIDTDGTTDVAVIVIGLLAAVTRIGTGVIAAHRNSNNIPLLKVVVVKVDAVCPVTFTPFIFH